MNKVIFKAIGGELAVILVIWAILVAFFGVIIFSIESDPLISLVDLQHYIKI